MGSEGSASWEEAHLPTDAERRIQGREGRRWLDQDEAAGAGQAETPGSPYE